MNVSEPYSFVYTNDRLYCEDVPLDTLAEEFGTPLYVYSASEIRSNIRQFREALKAENSRHSLSYALKANSNFEILRLIRNEDVGADVVSGGELAAALDAGFPADRVTFAGAGKRDDEILQGINQNILAFDVESDEELSVINELAGKAGRAARISIRVNPDVDAHSHPYISTGMSHNKFGIPIADAMRVYIRAAQLPNIEITGVHSHIGSQITSAAPFSEAAASIADLVKRLHSEGITLAHVNFGGGYGVQYHNVVRHPLLHDASEASENSFLPSELLQHIFPIFRETGCPLIIEPGRSIIANAGVLLTRVLYRKQNSAKHFTIVDAAMNDLIRPCLYHAYHQIVPLNLRETETITTDVVGPICETADFLARDRAMPMTQRSDLLAVMSAGAYGYALSSNYNMRPRAAEILVEGKTFRCIREREKVADLYR